MMTMLLLGVSLMFPKWLLAAQDEVRSTQAQFKFSYENVTLSPRFNAENMGLLGGNILFQTDAYPWLSLGGASYGSVTGARGGFITLGLAADAKLGLSEDWQAHVGAFLGAGGGHGGYKLQGGGLMLRGAVGLAYHGEAASAELGFSQIRFPNGDVNSGQLYSAISYGFSSLLVNGWRDEQPTTEQKLGAWQDESKHGFGVVYRWYEVPKGVLNAAGGLQHATIGLVGVQWQHDWSDAAFVTIESEGAMGGKSNGYMQILVGGGLQYALWDDVKLKLSASAGVAGGGNVDTGGGLLTDVAVAVQTHISQDMSLTLQVAWVDSILADFKAQSYAVQLSQGFEMPDVQLADAVPLRSLIAYTTHHLRMRTVHQSYFEPAAASRTKPWRLHHVARDVNLLGFQSDYFLGEHFFLSGQGIAAYEGQAGGYMTGLIGAGLRFGLPARWSAEIEGLVGAAGGGGLAVGGGLVWQVNAGLGYQLATDYSALLQFGRMGAVKGDFQADVLSASLAYHFSMWMK